MSDGRTGAFGSATLVLEGPSGGVRLDLTPGRATLGRTPDNDVVLTDPAASSKHAELYSDEAGLYLRDLGSSNGTYVNGKAIQTVALFDGDLVRIGQSQGRIAVLRPNGRPLRPKGSRAPIIAAIVTLVFIVAAALAVKTLLARRNAERTLFESYQQQAHDLLAGKSLCDAVSPTRLDVLQSLQARTAHVALGDHGHLRKADRIVDDALVAPARERTTQAQKGAALIAAAIDSRAHAASALKSYGGRFADPNLVSAVRALELAFAQQQEIAQEYLKSWKDSAADAAETQAQLDALLAASGPQARTAAERLDADAVRNHPDLTKARAACATAYQQAIDSGISRLAQIAL